MTILATAPSPTFDALDGGEQHVLLRLRAGASPWPSWNFGATDRGLQIVVGSDPHCDWQIASAGVAEQELEVFFTGRALLVRSLRPGRGARLNGVKLGEGWAAVPDGARLDLGLASIEVSIRASNDAASEPPAAHPTLLQPEWPNLASSVRGRAEQVDDWERASQQDAHTRYLEAVVDADAQAGVTVAQNEPPAAAVGHLQDGADTRSAHDPVSGAHLFQDSLDDSLGTQPVLIRYAAYAFVLGIAYAVWVMLLDRL